MLIGIGQTAAVLCCLLYSERDAFHRRKSRYLYTLGFYILLVLSQAQLHRYISQRGLGSFPVLEFLALSCCLYAVFLFLWSHARWEICCFLAFVFLLVDNCIWPLVSGLSRTLWGLNYLYDGRLLLRIPFILTLSILECLLTLLIRRMLPEMEKIRLNIYDAVLAASLVLPFLYYRSVAGQSTSQDNKTVQVVMTLCCLVGIITLAGEVGRSSHEYEKMREEKLRSVLQSQQAMFEQRLNDADLINRKYHDMKNFLLYLRADGGNTETAEAAEQLLKSIESYGASVSTGNEVIDVILSEKLRVCAEEEIRCVPYLDGQMFGFIKPLDLCTLLGNALDNAIESCRQIPEKDRRYISLRSVLRGETLFLTVRNTFRDRPDLRNGLPATTKAEKSSHGYGLRNIRYLAESYGGSISCRIEDEEFVLRIVLVRPEKTPSE